jgi:cysteine desulfurase
LAAREAVERARRQAAAVLGADRRDVFFVSGATEANNLGIKGLAARAERRRHIVTVATEHPAVLEPLRALAEKGFEVDVLPVDKVGLPDLEMLAASISDRTLVVSVCAANNEIGTLAPLAAIGEIAHARGALLHTDAAQAVGKIDLDVEREGVDLLSFSAHKLYGPKGVGALYVRREHQPKLRGCIDGGGHERGLRGGTLNVPGIVGLGAACEIAHEEGMAEGSRLVALRDRFRMGLSELVSNIELNGPEDGRLPGNVNIRVPGVDADALMANTPNLAFSAGSACSAATPTPSHVLLAIGRSHDAAEESARFGFGRPTTPQEVDDAVEQLASAIARIRGARCSAQPIGAV